MTGKQCGLTARTLAAIVALSCSSTLAQADAEASFTAAKGYRPLQNEPLQRRFYSGLASQSANPGPIEKAIGLLLTSERPLDRVRLRVSYGQQAIIQPNGAVTTVAFVEVIRFNLGPTIRQSAIAAYGAENVGPATDFGVGPHVALRATFSAMQGANAVLRSLSRAEITSASARNMRCLAVICLSESQAGERRGWQPAQWAQPKPLARNVAQDKPSPIDLARRVLAGLSYIDPATGAWQPPEMVERSRPEQPFITLVIEQNLGQDVMAIATAREADLLDDSIAEIWTRVSSAGDTERLSVQRRPSR